jgi:hypothetical protein
MRYGAGNDGKTVVYKHFLDEKNKMNAKHIRPEVQEFLTASHITNVISGMLAVGPTFPHISSTRNTLCRCIVPLCDASAAASACVCVCVCARARERERERERERVLAAKAPAKVSQLWVWVHTVDVRDANGTTQGTSRMGIARASFARDQSTSSRPTRLTAKWATRASGARTIAA